MPTPKIVDLFSGVGGFSLGAHQAGFSSELAIDIDPDLTSSHKINFPRVKTALADIARLDPVATLRQFDLDPHSIAGIIGGPPCQGYSIIGKRDPTDDRNGLVGSFYRFVAAVGPRFFVMENVPGILDESVRGFLDDGIDLVSNQYTIVGPILLNASDFGAPTMRERVVVVGYKPADIGPLSVTDIRGMHTIKRSVVEAIGDLTGPEMPDLLHDRGHWSLYPERPEGTPLEEYALLARQEPPQVLGTKKIREQHVHGMVSGLRRTVHSDAVISRFADVEPGRKDGVSKYPRLTWDGLSPTLRAGTGKDRGSFQAARPIHPIHNRVITPREAARLQGFPDWFQFHETIWHSFRMIGNSISPHVSAALLRAIAERMEAGEEAA